MDEVDPKTNHARREAIRRAIAIGGASVIACLAFGKPAAAATVDGLIVALGGLIAWTTYHLISGRPDALALVALNTLPIWRESADPWQPTLAITSMAMLGVGIVMGLVNRPQDEVEALTAELSWWEPEFDGPA